jgi:hypothetical protein
MTERRAGATSAAMLALMVASSTSAQELRVTGYAETDNIGYFEVRDAAGHRGRNEMLAQVDGQAVFGRPLRLFGSVELRADFADHDRDRVYVEELYGDFTYKALDLRLGRQIIAWGKADLVNPTDHLAPRDFTDPLESDDERLGVWAIRPRLQLGDAQWDGAIVPVFTGSIMPFETPRWSPPLPSQVAIEILPARKPRTSFENVQYATRFSTSVRGYDLSASYFDGWEDVPRLGRELVIGAAGTATLRLTPEHLRKRAVGGDVATVVGSYTVRGETAYIRPDPLRGPDYVQYVLGVERTFGDMMGSGGTFVLVQWIQSLLPGEFVPAPLDFKYLFAKATTIRVQRNLTASAQVVVEGLYEWARDGYYVQPSASYRFGPNLRLEGLVDLLGGREGEFFGLFADNKRVQFRVRYTF